MFTEWTRHTEFKSLNHSEKVYTLKSNRMCLNCMRPGHFVRNCRSSHRCRVFQNPHHTLLHIEDKGVSAQRSPVDMSRDISTLAASFASFHVTTELRSDLLLMTCRVRVDAQDGSSIEMRALLNSGSSASFIQSTWPKDCTSLAPTTTWGFPELLVSHAILPSLLLRSLSHQFIHLLGG